jgi:DNA-binding LacI/PurR family transcriptional regulator
MKTQVSTTYNSKAFRVADTLAGEIKGGKYASGTFMPTEGELARTYEVSPTTMRKSLKILARQGTIVHLPQRGTLVPSNSGAISSDPTGSDPARTKTKLSVAIVASGTISHSMSKFHEGIRDYSEFYGLECRSYMTEQGHEATMETLSHIEDLADGALIWPFETPQYIQAMQRLIQIRFPFVSFRPVPGLNMNVVMSNDTVGTYEAVNYLIEKYHRPVYYLRETEGQKTSEDRNQGYSQAMIDAGFGDQIASHTFRVEVRDEDARYWGEQRALLCGTSAAKKLLEAIEFPASVYCINDYVAASLYTVARERGVVIGKDLAVVGTDDLPLARFLKPGLTTVHAYIKEIGSEAAKLLHKTITGKVQKPVTIRLPLKLIVRDSA